MKTATTLLNTFLFAAILAGAMGCATTRIDVDVYKGPLANHPDVQTEEMAVMTIGAKPLLIELRDRLEWPTASTCANRIRYKDRTNLSWYRDTYVPPEPKAFQTEDGIKEAMRSHFTDERADRINQILWLYEDRDQEADPNLARLIREGKNALADFTRAYAIFRPASAESDTKFWDSLRIDAGYAQRRWPQKPIENEVKALIQAYQQFLTNPDRDNHSLFKAVEALNNTFTQNAVEWDLPLIPTQAEKSSNAQFQILAQTAFAKKHAALFIRDRGQQDRFAKQVQEISQAFLDSREALHRMFVLALEATIYLGKDLEVSVLAEKSPLVSADTFNALLHFIPKLVQPSYAIGAFACLRDRGLSPTLAPLSGVDKNAFAQQLDDLLLQNPAAVAQDLLALDNAARSNTSEITARIGTLFSGQAGSQISEQSLESMKSSSGWGFGIAIGPTKSGMTNVQYSDLVDRGRHAFTALGGSLGKGRLDSGIESLIEAYLEASYGTHDKTAENVVQARQDLQSALVRFAEKLLFIANNDKLLNRPANGACSCTSLNLDRYVLVLQSVGNSLLIQANELTHRDTYKEQTEKGYGREILALNRAYNNEPGKALDDLALYVSQSTNAAQKAAGKYDEEIDAAQKAKKAIEGDPAAPVAGGKSLADKQQALKDAKTALETAANTVNDLNGKEASAKESYAWFPAHANIPKSAEKGNELTEIRARFHAFLAENFTKEEDASGTALHTEVLKAIAGLYDTTDNIALRAALDAVRTDFEAAYTAAITPPTDTFKKTAFLDKVSAQLLNTWLSSRDAAHAATEDKDKKQTQTGTFETESATLKQQIEEKEKQIKQLITDRDESADVANTLAYIARLKPDVLRLASDQDIEPTSQGVIDALMRQLQNAKADAIQAGNKDEAAKLERVIHLVSQYPAPPMPPIDPSTLAQSSKDVLDDVIAMLREEHIKSVTASGSQSQQAQRLESSIQLAYAYRSGLVYIRPASAYLRSSYATTMLQNDPRLYWENMLGKHFIRNLPLIGPAIENRRLWVTGKIQADIDKQFWQNINQVRVSGAGRTNYVIAKDDIGNWYVKNYSADPEPIIKGAQSLALFSLGGELGTDLLGRLKAIESGAAPSLDVGTETTVLDRILAKNEKGYVSKTNAQLDDLTALLDDTDKGDGYSSALTKKLSDAWKALNTLGDADKEALSAALDAAAKSQLPGALAAAKSAQIDKENAEKSIDEVLEHLDSTNSGNAKPLLEQLKTRLDDPNARKVAAAWLALNLRPKAGDRLKRALDNLDKKVDVEEPGAAILKALKGILAFHNELARSVEGLALRGNPGEDATEEQLAQLAAAAKLAARNEVSNRLGEVFNTYIQGRRDAVKGLEDGVLFIGEMTSE